MHACGLSTDNGHVLRTGVWIKFEACQDDFALPYVIFWSQCSTII